MSRLLQINTNIGWNSVGRIIGRIGDAAMSAGWESYIAYSRDPGNEAPGATSRLIGIGSRLDRCRHGLLTRLTDAHGLGSAAATRALIRQIDAIAPDVVHLHNIHGYYINYQILCDGLGRSGVPVVWTLHDCWPLTGHCPYPDTSGCDGFVSGCHDCTQTHSYPASWFVSRAERNLRDKADAFGRIDNLTIVPVSHWLDGVAARSFMSGKRRIVIHNGIDTGVFAPSGDMKTRSVFAAASVWDERKGLADIVRLRELLAPDITVTVAGLSSSQSKTMPAGVTCVSRCDDARQLARHYSRAGVFVNLSSADNLPSVNLEAQACGTPVVCYDTGGMPETISAATGIAVGRGDVAAAASAVMRVLDNPKLYDGAECRRHILGHFDAAHAFDNYVDLYKRLSE